jgi:hypothetical protein
MLVNNMGWIILFAWLLCGFISMGINIAYFQRKYKSISEGTYRSDVSMALGMGLLCGPIALVTAFFLTGMCEYGWSLNPYKYKWKKNYE